MMELFCYFNAITIVCHFFLQQIYKKYKIFRKVVISQLFFKLGTLFLQALLLEIVVQC